MAAVHLIVGWVLLAASFLGVFGGALNLSSALGLLSNEPIGHLSGTAMLLGLGALAVATVILALIASQIFLFLWFVYLRFVPTTQVRLAERSLSGGMTLWQFEPQYSRMRKRMLGGNRNDV
jgi:hypothetical protein